MECWNTGIMGIKTSEIQTQYSIQKNRVNRIDQKNETNEINQINPINQINQISPTSDLNHFNDSNQINGNDYSYGQGCFPENLGIFRQFLLEVLHPID